MKIEHTKNKTQFQNYLGRFEEIFFTKSKTDKCKEVQISELIIKHHQYKYLLLASIDLVETIRYRME